MTENQDPFVVTYIFEEPPDADVRWHSIESGASAAAQLSALWIATRLDDGSADLGEWLDTGYRKHARRAKSRNFAKIIDNYPGEVIETIYGRVFASEPIRFSELPQDFKREQLSNFKVKPHRMPVGETSPILVTVNEDRGMSFGKAVVAAAHAVQNLITQDLAHQESVELRDWAEAGFPVEVKVGALPHDMVEQTYAKVEDFGLTEVPEGSVTAIAQLR